MYILQKNRIIKQSQQNVIARLKKNEKLCILIDPEFISDKRITYRKNYNTNLNIALTKNQ